jgi:hypothetical protein
MAPEPELAQGYSMTVAIGSLLLQGIRFTNLPFSVDVSAKHPLVPIWPTTADVELPSGGSVADSDFLAFAQGRRFLLREPELSLQPLRSAVDLPTSELVGSALKMQTPCGVGHVIFFPARLAQEGLQGRFHWFTSACECGTAYLVHVERDGAHFRSAGPAGRIETMYEELPGEEFLLSDGMGPFFCKQDEQNRSSRPQE